MTTRRPREVTPEEMDEQVDKLQTNKGKHRFDEYYDLLCQVANGHAKLSNRL